LFLDLRDTASTGDSGANRRTIQAAIPAASAVIPRSNTNPPNPKVCACSMNEVRNTFALQR
jgi:hypothetical protein